MHPFDTCTISKRLPFGRRISRGWITSQHTQFLLRRTTRNKSMHHTIQRHTDTHTLTPKYTKQRQRDTYRQSDSYKHTLTLTHTHRCRHKRTHAYHHYRHHQDNAIRADVASGFGEDGRTCTRLPSGARCRIYCLPLPMMPKYCEQATATLLSSNGLNSTCGRRGEVAPRKR